MEYINAMELPSAVPVMTLPSATLFPQALLPLYIFEPRYRRMLADTLKAHRMFIVAKRNGRLIGARHQCFLIRIHATDSSTGGYD